MKALEERWIHQTWTDLEKVPEAPPWATVIPSAGEGLQGAPEGLMAMDATQGPIPTLPVRRLSTEESPRDEATDREIAARARDHIYT